MLRWLTVFYPLVLLAACTPETGKLVLGVSAEEPGPGIAEEVRQLLTESGLAVEVRSIETSTDIIAALRNGDIDFGIIDEPARLIPGLATVLPLYPSILHVLYKGDQPADNFPGVIVGKRIYAGPPGGPAAQFLAQLGDHFDIDPGSYTVLDNPWVESPEVYFVFGGLLEKNSRRGLGDYRLFSFGDVARHGKGTVADGIALQYPNIKVFLLPAQIYNNLNPDTVLTLATRTVLVTAASTDVARVFDVTSILLANFQRLSSAYPLVTREMNEHIQLNSFTLPVHTGAQRSIDKDAPTLIQRYAQVFALGLTFVTLLVSMLITLYKSRKGREKDRVDGYYRKILALRRELQDSLSRDHCRRIEEQVINIQNEVFSLLVDQRVCANESLTIFLALSNQVLGEARNGWGAAPGRSDNVAYHRVMQRQSSVQPASDD